MSVSLSEEEKAVLQRAVEIALAGSPATRVHSTSSRGIPVARFSSGQPSSGQPSSGRPFNRGRPPLQLGASGAHSTPSKRPSYRLHV